MRFDRAAPWIAGLVLATPVLVAFYPPMTDLPFHEAAIGLLRHLDDPAFVPPGLYVRNLGEPNQLFHMVGWALSYVMSTRWAVKLLVAAAVLALPVTGARFARHVGASPVAALLVAPMALGWLFSWGLITNLIGLSALLATLPIAEGLNRDPSRRRVLEACGAVLLLYSAHEAMMFVFAAVVLGLCVLRPGSPRAAAVQLVPFGFALAVTFGQFRLQKRFTTPMVAAVPTTWQPLGKKLKEVGNIVMPATLGSVQLLMVALFALALGLLFWLRARERRAERSTAPVEGNLGRFERVRAAARVYRWEIVAVCGLAAYFAFPSTLHGATLVYERWFPPAFAILVLIAAPRELEGPTGRIARLAAAALPAAALVWTLPSFVDSDREYSSLAPLMAKVAPGSAVAAIDLGPWDPSRTFSLGPAVGRIMATRGGRLAYAFTDSAVSPVVLPRRYQWTESLVRVGPDSIRFMPAHDFKRFRYVLLRAADPGLKWMASYALASEATLVDEVGEWALFESKLDLVPLTSRDVPLETPTPETLRQRLGDLFAAARAQGSSAPPLPSAGAPGEPTP